MQGIDRPAKMKGNDVPSKRRSQLKTYVAAKHVPMRTIPRPKWGDARARVRL
jgi:hypothetical protein